MLEMFLNITWAFVRMMKTINPDFKMELHLDHTTMTMIKAEHWKNKYSDQCISALRMSHDYNNEVNSVFGYALKEIPK